MKKFASVQDLDLLPADVQDKVRDFLMAYAQVHVTFGNGQYSVSTGIGIQRYYPDDHRFVGTFRQVDVYDDDQRLQNYLQCFRDYPGWYKGPRDYAAIRAKYGDPPVMY